MFGQMLGPCLSLIACPWVHFWPFYPLIPDTASLLCSAAAMLYDWSPRLILKSARNIIGQISGTLQHKIFWLLLVCDSYLLPNPCQAVQFLQQTLQCILSSLAVFRYNTHKCAFICPRQLRDNFRIHNYVHRANRDLWSSRYLKCSRLYPLNLHYFSFKGMRIYLWPVCTETQV